MTVYEAAGTRRTVRKFRQEPIAREQLYKMVKAAVLAPSGANMQPLKYKIVDDAALAAKVFPLVKWAGYIAPTGDPAEGEEPTAYILILADQEIRKSGYELDAGAAAENLMLTAWEDGIGSCWMGAIDRPALARLLDIPERYIINTLIALGVPAEQPVWEPRGEGIRYYKDEQGVLHVPKRTLEEVLL